MDHRDSRINKIVKAGFLPGLVLFLTALLYIWNLWNEGYANLYYAAGVRSMGTNLHAFFFNSLDSAGFVSIDKPPLGFWVQVLFTKVLGFTGFALLLPQALAGVICVGLVYRMVSRRSNPKAGLFAALVLALTPIFTAVSRNNTIDSTLILVLLLASEQAIRAVERSRFKHLVFAGIWIGLGFNIKMLAAYTFVPAVFLLYLFAPGLKFLKKAGHMVLAFLIMALISLSWVTAVDLTPESNRPYVGSSSSNSALDLALGYNGLNRLIRGLGRNSRPTGTAGAVRPPLPNPAGAAGQPLPNPAGAAG
ncbi:MAG TPA: hypothetical protein DD727_01790, partial [Clostridiales bacterium]|nr:hypothetical protein [Clostridiales bacterium]